MKEQSLTAFEEFLERIIGVSKLEITGGKLSKAFSEESQRNEPNVNGFLEKFKPLWDSWKRTKGVHLVSPFFEEHPQIFKDWLSAVFPFSHRRVEVDCLKGGSMVDCQGYIYYTYSPEERELIKKMCEKFQIPIPEQEVDRLLITNALKTLDPMLSKLIGMNYRLFIDKIDFFERTGKLALKVDFVGRIG
ncbi:MAG: hypothetical protein LUQ65_14745 [Candidatus Helarchaeota archaeon]|nr:hypothetical protein [Candidatus Helarchaeota archaeon]